MEKLENVFIMWTTSGHLQYTSSSLAYVFNGSNRLTCFQRCLETSSAPSQWRVFLLCEPADHLPVGLLLFSHQLAWDVVQREGLEYQPLDSKDLELKTIITSTLEV